MKDEEWYVILNMNFKYEICRKCPKSGLFKGSYKECEKWIEQKKKEEMTDEELAKEYSKSACAWLEDREPLDERDIQQAFLAGLKAGRPQWHDLRKDPTDLPKFEGDYMCALLNSNHSSFILSLAIEDGLKYWQDCEDTDWTNEVIAWCELPTFDKE